MPRDVILGLDIGGSVVKATAFDLSAAQSVTRSRPVPVVHPGPGENERDARALWHAVADVIHEVVDALPVSTWVAVGITAHGNGLYLVDGRGRPTRAAIMASDTRATGLVRRWVEAGVKDALAPLTWNRLWPGQPGPILAWLQEHEPDALTDAEHALMCKDFVRAQLTGAVATEVTDQSCNGLYDNAGRRYCDEAFEALGIADQRRLMLPPGGSREIGGEVTREAAELTGIPAGTPVFNGVVDNVALQLGSAGLDTSTICVAAGTWSVNQLLVRREEMTLSGSLGAVDPFAACEAADPSMGLLIDASPTSAGTLAWALDHAVRSIGIQARHTGVDVFELALRRVATLAPQADDPMFVPYLDGSRDHPAARAAWFGLSSGHGEDELLGAVIEGVCLEHRRHIERLTSDRLRVRLSGGAARSATWVQRFADVTACSVATSSSQELGAVGAAVIAGVGAGLFSTLEYGLEQLGPTWDAIHPDPDMVDHYEHRYRRYCEVADWTARMS
jgi:L-xylulokinase